MRDVKVVAIKNFDNHAVGDEFWAPMTEATAHLIVSHYLELVWDPTWNLVDDGESSVLPPGAGEDQPG